MDTKKTYSTLHLRATEELLEAKALIVALPDHALK